jgi:SnoaL-like domain
MANPTETLLRQFYTDFEAGHADAVIAALHPQCVFQDPIFQTIPAGQVPNMIRMLCASATPGRKFEVQSIEVSGADAAIVKWHAHYVYPATGRKVLNKITTPFKFQDGKVIYYTDQFSLWRWLGMALGTKGWLMGWHPAVHAKVRSTVAARLQKFVEKG